MHPGLLCHAQTLPQCKKAGTIKDMRRRRRTGGDQRTPKKKPTVAKLWAFILVEIGGLEPPTSAL
jgi:hypothetical protein